MGAEVIDGKRIAEEIRAELRPRIASLQTRAETPGLAAGLVRQPLPSQIPPIAAVWCVSPWKDVDCFHPENVGLLLIGIPRFAPATPAGVVELLLRSGHDPSGKHVVILGPSHSVGK